MNKKKTDTSESQLLHDISTPLSVIYFQLEALMNSADVSDQLKRITLAYEQTKKITELIENHRAQIKRA